MGLAAVQAENLPPEGVYTGVAVDNHSLAEHAGIPKGSTLITDMEQSPLVKHRQVVVTLRGEDGYWLFQFLEETASSYRMKDLATGKGRSLKKHQVSSMHLVYSTVMS